MTNTEKKETPNFLKIWVKTNGTTEDKEMIEKLNS